MFVTTAAGAPHGLAVDRYHLALEPDRQRLRPSREAGLERLRVEQHEDPPEGVVRGDAVWQLQEGLQPSPLAPPVKLNSSQLSAQAITAQTAIARMSIS